MEASSRAYLPRDMNPGPGDQSADQEVVTLNNRLRGQTSCYYGTQNTEDLELKLLKMSYFCYYVM